jgi:hypothetical protein
LGRRRNDRQAQTGAEGGITVPFQVKQAYAVAIPIARKLYALQCEATGDDSPAARSRVSAAAKL